MCIFALRQCADYAHVSYMWVQMRCCVARVKFAVGSRSCLVFAAMAPLHCCPRPPSPSPIKECRAYRTVWCAYGLYLWPWVGHMYVINDIPRDIPERDYYVRTYVLRENRSSIQSLALMCSAITMHCDCENVAILKSHNMIFAELSLLQYCELFPNPIPDLVSSISCLWGY